MRILLTGKNGQLGFELQQALVAHGQVIAVGRDDCDFAQPEQIVSLVEQTKPDLIVNPAAYTAVDNAESEPELAFAINATAPKVLAAQANLLGIPLIHYSTDYVFDGACLSEYEEDDLANPLSIYGLSKWQGEQNIRSVCAQHIIIRTEWVYGAHGNNFLKRILQLAMEKDVLEVVADQYGSPTSTNLIAQSTSRIITEIIQNKKSDIFGTYHVVPNGHTNWHGYAVNIVRQAHKLGVRTKLQPESIQPISLSAYKAAASRPKNCLLSTQKFRSKLKIEMPDWQTDVEQVLTNLVRDSNHAV